MTALLLVPALALSLVGAPAAADSPRYPWLAPDAATSDTLATRIAPPPGFTRVPAQAEGFAAWLRQLPLRPPGAAVHLHDGSVKPNQRAHHAVVALDVGARDLQQCADAIIRLRSEYLWSRGDADAIAFEYTSGTRVPWSKWRRGWRPKVQGRDVTWVRSASASRSRATFARYLRAIMTYAGTASLSRELETASLADLAPGDALIQGGFPGHAVLVLDEVRDDAGERLILLGQSYMPAQDFHVLVNPADPARSPWFRVADLAADDGLATPEWRPFTAADIRTF